MEDVRIPQVVTILGLAVLGGVAGFTGLPVRTAPFEPSSLQLRPRLGLPYAQRPINRQPSASEGGVDDGTEDYKKQLSDFMAQAHEKRLQAMDAAKAEVQRTFEEQISELQSKLAESFASASTSPSVPIQKKEPALAGSAAEAEISRASVASPAVNRPTHHPSYYARLSRPGWEARWGPEEMERASISASMMAAADATFVETGAAGIAWGAGSVHPAYGARAQRPGWEARWGAEEPIRMASTIFPAAAVDAPVTQTSTAALTAGMHPAYAVRAQRPGWEARWGAEEPARMASTISSAAAVDAPVKQTSTAALPGDVHPAYAARAKRPGWEARWGEEEPARMASVMSPAAAVDTSMKQTSTAALPANVHPAYAARANRPGWEARWGAEEPARMASVTSTAAAADAPVEQTSTAALSADVHPAYAARAQRPGWEARWGAEEPARVASTTPSAAAVDAPVKQTSTAALAADVHPAYAARAQRPGWEARWGAEEPARVASTTPPAAAVDAPMKKTSTAALAAGVHPAYAERLQRPGWDARWGNEEKDRVEGTFAGAIAAEGAAAGFATAGGLDTKVEGTPVEGADAAAATSSDKSLVGESLPDDVSELRELVESYRQNFLGYMLRSQQESNELRSAKAKIEGEVSRLNDELAAEQALRVSLQESFLDYMTRSGIAGADEKMRTSHLESSNARLVAEAEELRRFTQKYMVKASSEKQKAVEATIANQRAQAKARIAELEEEVKKLQADS